MHSSRFVHNDSSLSLSSLVLQRSVDDKLTILFMHQLSLDARLTTTSNTLASTDDRLAHLEKLCSIGWSPNKPQYVSFCIDVPRPRYCHTDRDCTLQKMLRALMRHYTIKALPTYTALSTYVKVCVVYIIPLRVLTDHTVLPGPDLYSQ